MRKFLRKTLIYLLAVGMLCPAWLATGVLKATHAKAAGEVNTYEFSVTGVAKNYQASSDLTSTPAKDTDPSIAFPGQSPISVKVAVDENKGVKYPNNVIVPAGSAGDKDIQLWAEDTNGNWWDINKVGWGNPGTGFPIDLEAVTNVYPVMKEGSYPIDLKLVDFTNPEIVVAEYEGSIVSDHVNPTIATYTIDNTQISPNDDDVKDTASIDLAFSEECSYTVNILDQEKNVVRELASGKATDPKAKVWGGKDNDGMIVADGDYTVDVEVTDVAGNVTIDDAKEITVDTVAPLISGIKDGDVTNQDVAPVIDDAAAEITLKDAPFVSGTVISEGGDYVLSATDLAGNNTTVNFTIDKTAPIATIVNQVSTPTSNTSPVVTIKVENGANWKLMNGSTVLVSGVGDGTDQRVALSDLKVGAYKLVLTATDQAGNETTIGLNEFVVEAVPAVTPAVTPTPAPAPAPAVTVGPSKAQAAAPASSENSVQTPTDDSNGQIKGDETSNTNDEEKTNWTPWIVLFVLIILAGAATGGYFYWFNGEEEVKTVVKEAKKTEVKKAPEVKASVKKPANKKKQKRW